MSLAAFGGEPGAVDGQPKIVGKITAALAASKVDCLTPRVTREGGRQFSYALKSVSYLGVLELGPEKFLMATASFVRSAPQGGEPPPARGFPFLLCLSTDFRLLSYCRLSSPDVELAGTVLRRRGETVVDFGANTFIARRHGFLIDGSYVLAYPGPDSSPAPGAKSK